MKIKQFSFLFLFFKSVWPLDLKYSFINNMLAIRNIGRSDQTLNQRRRALLLLVFILKAGRILWFLNYINFAPVHPSPQSINSCFILFKVVLSCSRNFYIECEELWKAASKWELWVQMGEKKIVSFSWSQSHMKVDNHWKLYLELEVYMDFAVHKILSHISPGKCRSMCTWGHFSSLEPLLSLSWASSAPDFLSIDYVTMHEISIQFTMAKCRKCCIWNQKSCVYASSLPFTCCIRLVQKNCVFANDSLIVYHEANDLSLKYLFIPKIKLPELDAHENHFYLYHSMITYSLLFIHT